MQRSITVFVPLRFVFFPDFSQQGALLAIVAGIFTALIFVVPIFRLKKNIFLAQACLF